MKARAKEALRLKRARKRRGVCLEDRGITENTRDRYSKAVHEVLPFLEHTQLSLEDAVAEWVETTYRQGEGITKVSDCLSGLHHYMPWCKGKLTKPWRLFKIWRKAERPKQAPPLPRSVLFGLIGRLLEEEDLIMAVCLSLGFFGMLRTGELLTLTWGQILLGKDDLVIQLGDTKTGLRRAVDENVVIKDPLPWLLTKTLRETRIEENRQIWAKTPQQFRERFKSLIAFFDLPPSFKPYSLRRGGATADFRSHGSMERTLMRGRWGTSGAARNYVQEGLSALTKIKLTPPTATLLAHYAQFLQWLFSHAGGRGKPGGSA